MRVGRSTTGARCSFSATGPTRTVTCVRGAVAAQNPARLTSTVSVPSVRSGPKYA